MGVERGGASKAKFLLGQQFGKFLVFLFPFRPRIKNLRNSAPANVTDERGFFFAGGWPIFGLNFAEIESRRQELATMLDSMQEAVVAVTRDGLVSYGPDRVAEYPSAAGYVYRILMGEKPANLPVQAPTKYELAINLKTAKTLSLNVPTSLLARANEVIE